MKARVLPLIPLTLMAAAAFAPAPATHPRIEGAAHIAYYVTDLSKARAYYTDFLGFEEAFALPAAAGSDHIVFIKINDQQFIALFRETPTNHGFLHDLAFWTRDAAGLRAALAATGLTVPPLAKDEAGDPGFEVTDPFGYHVRIVQYAPDSRTGATKGKSTPSTRISDHIDHMGILIGDEEVASRFYGDVLGFEAEGDGRKRRIGVGTDRFELGFERRPPTADRFHVKNHVCLSVPDVPKVAAMLQAKPAAKTYREIETHVLDNGKHVAEMYDPDGNRVELMEPPSRKD